MAKNNGMINFLSEFIQHSSVAPKKGSANVKKCADWLIKQLNKWGWGKYINIYEKSKNEPNIVIRLPGSSDKPNLIFAGHLDVVSVSEESKGEWQVEPFGGVIEDNKVWGRGSSDMKGGITAFLWAAKQLWEHDKKFKNNLVLIINIGEESARPEVGIKYILKQGIEAPLNIVAEPTNLKLSPAGPGWFFFQLLVKGKGTHPANRYKYLDESISILEKPGIDGIEKLKFIMNRLENLEKSWLLKTSEYFPDKSMNMSCVYLEAGDKEAQIAEQAEAVYAVIFYPQFTFEEVIEEIKNTINIAIENDKWLKQNPPKFTAPVIDPVWHPFSLKPNNPNLNKLSQIIKSNLGDCKIQAFTSPSDANFIAQTGNDTFVLGPGDLSFGCHGNNEFIPIKQLFDAKNIFAEIIKWRCL